MHLCSKSQQDVRLTPPHQFIFLLALHQHQKNDAYFIPMQFSPTTDTLLFSKQSSEETSLGVSIVYPPLLNPSRGCLLYVLKLGSVTLFSLHYCIHIVSTCPVILCCKQPSPRSRQNEAIMFVLFCCEVFAKSKISLDTL
jgi:hypothetical protein